MNKSVQAIDLGTLQVSLGAARKELLSNTKALRKAEEDYNRSRKAFDGALEALEAAAKAVLNGG